VGSGAVCQAVREGSIRVAASQRRNRVVDGGTNVDVVGGDRLATACVDRASPNRDPSVICVHLTQGKHTEKRWRQAANKDNQLMCSLILTIFPATSLRSTRCSWPSAASVP